jgi:hypothetical protein
MFPRSKHREKQTCFIKKQLTILLLPIVNCLCSTLEMR